MILKKIAKLCRKSRHIVLCDEERGGTQWLGDGAAMYPLHGMPELDEETVFLVLDIPEEKRGEFKVEHKLLPSPYCYEDSMDGERMILDSEVAIKLEGSWIAPARTSLGLWFYNPAYLEPLADLDGVELWERETEYGQIYLAAKSGMFLVGLIMPMLPKPVKLAGILENLSRELRTTVSYLERESSEELLEKAGLRIDPETGEVVRC